MAARTKYQVEIWRLNVKPRWTKNGRNKDALLFSQQFKTRASALRASERERERIANQSIPAVAELIKFELLNVTGLGGIWNGRLAEKLWETQ